MNNNHEVYLAQPMAIDSYYSSVDLELEKELQYPIDAEDHFIPLVEEEPQELFNNDRHVFTQPLTESGAPSVNEY
jgi:hypothetical protein